MLNPALPSPQAGMPPVFDWIPETLPEDRPQQKTVLSDLQPTMLLPPGARGRRLKHGLYSQHTVAPGEDGEEFAAYRQQLMEELRPGDADEEGLVQQMAQAQWHLERVWGLEVGVYTDYDAQHPEQAEDPSHLRLARCFIADCKDGQALDRLSRHQMRLSNAYHKAARQLALRKEQRAKALPMPRPRQAHLPDREPAPLVAPSVATDSIDTGSVEIAESPEEAVEVTVSAEAPVMVEVGPEALVGRVEAYVEPGRVAAD